MRLRNAILWLSLLALMLVPAGATSGEKFEGRDKLDVSLGYVSGLASVNKFGRAPSGVQTTATDIWDRADATPTQQIWLAPTAARVHAIVSTSTDDADAGTGARTVTVYGLTSWSSAETTETITMDGTTPVNTTASYVIVHRLRVMSSGASGPNAGVITATAATDSTVTAAIRAGVGQSGMAIYGVPEGKTGCVTCYYASALGGIGATAGVNLSLKVNPFPDEQPAVFVNKHTNAVLASGSSYIKHSFDTPACYDGPAIIKLQGTSTAADTDVSGGFDMILHTQ